MCFPRRMLFVSLACAAIISVQGKGLCGDAAEGHREWAPREFPLVAWGGPPGELNNEVNWKIIKDGGYTVGLSAGSNVAEHRKTLDICRKIGIPVFVIDQRITPDMTAKPGWRKVMAETIADYRHPALYGIYGWDEPASDLFGRLGAISDEFRKQAPNLLLHLNIFPNYATPEQLGTPTYREHVERFVSTVKPQVLCFDNYSVMANGTIRPNYFENLATIREYALKSGRAAWMFIFSLSAAFNDLAVPSEGEMRFQAFTALAYGMKGILYWVYWPCPPLVTSAVVDVKGKPTGLYPIIKRLNGDIRAIGRTLLTLTSTGTYHTGPIPPGATRLPLDAPLQLSNDRPLVVGFFVDPDKTQYALVANADPHQAVDFTIVAHPEIKRLLALSPRDGTPSPVALSNGTAAYHMQAGDGRLFRLETEFKYPQPKMGIQP
ncbi:MAG: hypothetical protein WCB27_19915 [Thermoguttaceae bacterium]